MVRSRHQASNALPPGPSVPDAETLRLHLGELTQSEVRVAQAAYRLALSHITAGATGISRAQHPAIPVSEMLLHYYETAYLAEWHQQVKEHGSRPGFNGAKARRAAELAGVTEVARRITQTQGVPNVD